MKRKVRIFSTLVSLCLVAVLMCVGIYAATTASVTGQGGYFIYNGIDAVAATVKVSGDLGMYDGAAVPAKTVKLDETAGQTGSVEFGTWEFANLTDSVVFYVEVTNDFQALDIKSTLAATVAVDDFTVTITGGTDGVGTITPGQFLVYTVIINCTATDKYQTVQDTLSFSLTLERVEAAG